MKIHGEAVQDTRNTSTVVRDRDIEEGTGKKLAVAEM